jgi:hypothetical protein
VPTENLETSERLWLILASEFSLMLVFLKTLLAVLPSILSSRAAFELKNLALRHQIGVLQRSAAERPKLTAADRLFWICLSRLWREGRQLIGTITGTTVKGTASSGGGSPKKHRKTRGLTHSLGPATT